MLDAKTVTNGPPASCWPSTPLARACARGIVSAHMGSAFRSDELFAGSLGSSDDPVEARITAQRIPARIEAQIAIRWGSPGHRRDNFELLQRAVALARPRINQR